MAVTSRFLRLAGQAYYRCVDAPATTRERKQAYLENAFFDAHRDDPEVGYQLLGDETREASHQACDHTMWRISAAGGSPA